MYYVYDDNFSSFSKIPKMIKSVQEGVNLTTSERSEVVRAALTTSECQS